jgi:dipeptidyl aminopeptidase/acylaminoacyl peptidase
MFQRLIKHAGSFEGALALAILFLILQLIPPFHDFISNYPIVGKQVTQYWAGDFDGLAAGYLITLPGGYGKHPLVIVLHGSGERGSSTENLKACGLANALRELGAVNAIVVLPQCLKNEPWNSQSLIRAIDELCRRFDVDCERISLLGYSMGAFAAWDLAAKSPDRISAIAAFAGGSNTEQPSNLRNVPAWALHGDCDVVVPLEKSREIVDAVNRSGGDARLTVLPNRDHGIEALRDILPEVIRWLLQHNKSTAPMDNSWPLHTVNGTDL